MPTYEIKNLTTGRTERIRAESPAAALERFPAGPGERLRVTEVPSVRGMVIELGLRAVFGKGKGK